MAVAAQVVGDAPIAPAGEQHHLISNASPVNGQL